MDWPPVVKSNLFLSKISSIEIYWPDNFLASSLATVVLPMPNGPRMIMSLIVFFGINQIKHQDKVENIINVKWEMAGFDE